MADSNTALQFGPAWCSRQVPTFSGMHDTHIDDGDDYSTITLADIFTMPPGEHAKGAGPAFIPSSYFDFDARKHASQRERGSFVALCGDIDSGDHTLDRIKGIMRGFSGKSACLIYSSAHARAGDMRWRIVLPLETPASFDDWHDAQHAFFNFMEEHGVEMDRALDRAGQPVYLPNVPAIHAKSGTRLRGEDGKPLYYDRATTGCNAPGLDITAGPIATGVADIIRKRASDERDRERIRAEALERRANKPQTEGGPVMEEFNKANSISALFELYGYEQSPRNPDDWRSPKQTSDSYATRIIGDTWVSLSASDVGARLGANCKAGCFGDAYDLFVHYEHGGDHKSAFRTLYSERRTSAPLSAPPPVDADDPGWSEPPHDDGAQPEDVFMASVPDEVAAENESDTFDLLDITQMEAMPPPAWLVHEAISEDGLSIIYGEPGAGKSFIALDLALRVSAGQDWFGRKTQQVGVIYIAAEGARGMGKRITGWKRHHGIGSLDVPFVVLPMAVQILDPADRAKMIRTIDEAKRRMNMDVGLIIVDTVSRSIAGVDENAQDTMTQFVRACDDIKRHSGGALIGIHHSGKDKEKGMRGSSVLLGAVDASIRLNKSEDLVSVNFEKQKDAEEARPFYAKMQKITWEPHENALPEDMLSTLVPVPSDAPKTGIQSLSMDMIASAFGMMADAWSKGVPLSNKPQTRTDGRYAPIIFRKHLGGDCEAWKDAISAWLENGNVMLAVADKTTKKSGLQVLDAIA